jgi:hypothetical protein
MVHGKEVFMPPAGRDLSLHPNIPTLSPVAKVLEKVETSPQRLLRSYPIPLHSVERNGKSAETSLCPPEAKLKRKSYEICQE